MALRLLRWLGTDEVPLVSFPRSAKNYMEETAFVDWAREEIAGGEAIPEISSAYAVLDRLVAVRRREENRVFAETLKEWAGADPPLARSSRSRRRSSG